MRVKTSSILILLFLSNVWASLALAAPVIVISPKPGDVWSPSGKYNVVWSIPSATPKQMNILLLKGGYTVKNLGQVTSGPAGVFSWSPGSTPLGNDYQIRVVATDNSMTGDSQIFSIGQVKHVLNLTQPGPGGTYRVGQTMTIAWTYSGTTGAADETDVGLYMSCRTPSAGYEVIPGGRTPLGQNGVGSYQWKIPSYVKTSQGCYAGVVWGNPYSPYVRAEGKGVNEFNVINDAERNQTGYIDVVSPAINSRITLGTTVPIRWNFASWMNNPVNIYAGSKQIASAIPIGSNGSGSINWTPDSMPWGDTAYSITVSTVNNSHRATLSPIYLTCNKPLSVSGIKQGDLWEIGTQRTVTWAATSGQMPSAVDIDLINPANNSRVADIARNVPAASGRYDWTVTDKNGYYSLPPGTYKFLVRKSADYCPMGYSESFQTVKPGTVKALNPAGNTELEVGMLTSVSWVYQANYPNMKLKIDLYKKSAGKVATIASNINLPSAQGQMQQPWYIPPNMTVGTDYYLVLEMSGANATTVVSQSATTFSIVPKRLPKPVLPHSPTKPILR